LWTANGFAVCRKKMARPVPKPRGFCCAPQAVPTGISQLQKSAFRKFSKRSDSIRFNQSQPDMNTNSSRLDRHQEIKAKNSCTHSCAHECLSAVGRQPTPRESTSREGKSAENGTDQREKNLHRAIVAGTVVILLLVIAVYYLRYVAPGRTNVGSSHLGIAMIARY